MKYQLFFICCFTSFNLCAVTFSSSFLCEEECSSPGLNQLIFDDSGEFRIFASLTPKKATLAKGRYSADKSTVQFIHKGIKISFKMGNLLLQKHGRQIAAVNLIWVSGETSYFKKGIKFIETIPVLYGVPSTCYKTMHFSKDPNDECYIHHDGEVRN